MADKSADPMEMWRAMMGEMEKGFNTIANQAMASPEFSKAMNQAGAASAGAQKQMGDFMERYLAGINMPSRAQLTNFGERLAALESQMAEALTLLRDMRQNEGHESGAPKPARTRRPPANGEAS